MQHQQPFKTSQLTAQTVFSALSNVFERTSYYGIRSFAFLYAATAFNFTQKNIGLFFSILLYAPMILRPFGGFLADKLLGYRMTMVLANIIMTLGSLAFMIPSPLSFYIGLALVILSNSMYSPAALAQLLNVYNGNDKKRDGAITTLYLAVNLGAFFGPFLIALTGSDFNYLTGFLAVSITSVISLVFSLLCAKKLPHPNPSEVSALRFDKKLIIVIAIILFSAFFWMAYQYQGLQLTFSFYPYKTFNYLQGLIPTGACLLFTFLLAVIWFLKPISTIRKWIIGFSIALLAIVLTLSTEEKAGNLPWIIVSTVLFSLAEVLTISLQSKLLYRYASHRYLATIIGCLLGAATAISTILPELFSELYISGWIHVVLLLLPLIALILFVRYMKDPSKSTLETEEAAISENDLLDQ